MQTTSNDGTEDYNPSPQATDPHCHAYIQPLRDCINALHKLLLDLERQNNYRSHLKEAHTNYCVSSHDLYSEKVRSGTDGELLIRSISFNVKSHNSNHECQNNSQKNDNVGESVKTCDEVDPIALLLIQEKVRVVHGREEKERKDENLEDSHDLEGSQLVFSILIMILVRFSL